MSKRDDILSAAMSLFNQYGYHTVGVDWIRDEAQVSKMTLYKYFLNKEVLVEEVLKLRHEAFKASIESAVLKKEDAKEKFVEIFNWHLRWFSSGSFHGCMFIKAAGEFPQTKKVADISIKHKEWIYFFVLNVLQKMKAESAEEKARYIQISLDGMIVNANIFQDIQYMYIVWESISHEMGISHMKLDRFVLEGRDMML
jgi:AcrR family transcriptional regulator|tara:strand:+ start:41679 stop:42272 length:594 start_codon:yes stop_codon:yes gene_type:complete